MLQRSRNALARWPDQQRGEEFYGMGGWKDERTREEEERNGRASILTSVSASKDDLLYETSLGWKGGGWHNFSSMGGGGGGSVARSPARRLIPTLPPEPFVCFRISKRVRPSSARVFPPASRQPLNFIFFRSPAPDAHDRSLTCLLGRESKTKARLPSRSLPFLPPYAGYLPILWSHYSER